MRQRRPLQDGAGNPPGGGGGGGSEALSPLLDTDDQDALVQAMQAQAVEQHEQIEFIFRIACVTASVVALLCAILVHRQRRTGTQQGVAAAAYAHTAASCALNALSSRTVRQTKNSSLKWSLLVPLALYGIASSLLLWRARANAQEDLLTLHQGLLFTNLFIAAAAIFLRYDASSMEIALQDLHSAKYQHKTL